MANSLRLKNWILAFFSFGIILVSESFLTHEHGKIFSEAKNNYTVIVIVSNTSWSAITTGSGPGGQPTCADDITISGNTILTVDINNVQCQNLFINKNADGTTSQLKFNAGSQLTVCADVVVGSSLGLARAGVLDMTSGGVLKLNGSFMLTPSLSNFLSGTGTIEYAGATAQSITATTYNNLSTTGSLVKSLGGAIVLNGNLSIGSGTTLDVSTGNNFPITLAGDWINSGTFTQRTGAVIFNGVTQTVKGSTTTAFSTLTIFNGSTVTGLTASTASIANINSGGKYIQTAGTSILGSSSKNFVSGSSYELQLASASGFNFSGNTYGNLIVNFSGSSGLNTNGVLTTVANDLVIRNTGTSAFRFASSQSPTININGHLKIEAGAVEVATTTGVPVVNVGNNFEQTGGSLKLSISSTGGQQFNVNGNILLSAGTFQPMTNTGIPVINLKSDWINNGGNFIPGSSTVNFNGSLAQNIAGNNSTTFNNLGVNNVAGISLNTVDATINGNLNFLNGKFSTASKKLILGSTATVTAAGTGKYVTGVLRKSIPSAINYSFVFPIGDNLNFAPVTIDFTGTTTNGTVDASSNTLGNPPALASGLSQSKYINRKWSVINNGVSFTSYNATFNFPDNEKIGSPNTANFTVRKFNGGSWSATTTGTLTSNSSQATGLTSFSEFEIGEAECNFPDASNFNITASNSCAGSSTSVIVNSSSLSNGNYIVNYDLSGSNNSPNNNSSLVINSSSGNFSTIPLLNNGSTTIHVKSISSGNCLAPVSNNSIFFVNPLSTGDTTALACDSFSWYGVKYFSSVSPTHALANSVGCDSIVTLHLTINHSSSGGQTIAACDSYTWNGTVYTTSGDKTHLFPNGNSVGCDSTAILHLTINHSTSGEQTISACDSYTWNGTVYTTSGDKTHLFPNGNSVSCDSTAILHLTINHSTTGEQTISACDSYSWNETVYTTSGDKTHLFPNGNSLGCDSTAVLHLTINHSTSGEQTISACDSYNWNGTVYTTSGDKTHLFPNGNAAGCDSTATLHLTIYSLTVGGTVSPNATICTNNNSGLLALTGQIGSVTRWEFSADNIAWNPIANTTSSYTSTALTQSTWFRAIVKNGTCNEQPSMAALITVNDCNSCSNNPKPVVTSINLSANSVPVNSSVTLNASFTDNANGGPYSVDVDWNDGTTHTLLNLPNSNSTLYNFSASHNYTISNVYEIKLRVTDGCNGISDIVPGTSTWQYLAVYVTGNEFTTMGGWFNAPAGSYAANPEFTGKVNMGNVVRPNNPNNKGELELNINGQNFYVHSISPTNWDYLTISGCCLATFKGSATINNSGNYKILVSQTDKNANCSGFNGNNKVRVKIWNPATNEILFETQPGDLDNAMPTLALNGGAIQVHKPSCNVAIKTTGTRESEILVYPNELLVTVKPNPTESNFAININSNSDEIVLVKISDLNGRLITILKTKPATSLTVGGNLKAGIYLAEISQGNRKKIIKLLKQ